MRGADMFVTIITREEGKAAASAGRFDTSLSPGCSALYRLVFIGLLLAGKQLGLPLNVCSPPPSRQVGPLHLGCPYLERDKVQFKIQ
jgi:hypothetical protein